MKTSFVIFFILTLSNELQSRSEVDWFDSVNTRLLDAQNVHSSVIIHDHNTSNCDVVKDRIFGKIIGSMPSVIVEIDDGDSDMIVSDFGVVSKLSTSLLFVFYAEYSGDNIQIFRMITFINELADFAVNYLIIILKTSSNSTRGIEDILEHAWSESILNILIVEIRLEKNLDNPLLLNCNVEKYKKVNQKIVNDNSNQVIIHQFHPFIKKFHHEKFSPKIELFPNFVNNMHGHPLNVVVFNQEPYSSVNSIHNGTNIKPYKKSGPDIRLIRAIAKKLNFTPNFIFEPPRRLRPTNMTLENIIRMMKEFRLDIYASIKIPETDEIMEQSIRSRTILKSEMGVIMPKKYENNKKKLKNILESSSLTLVIIIIIWFAVILLKFDDKVWQLCSIYGLIFSIAIPHQPSRHYERILFLIVAMMGFMYSNDIYASLMNLGIGNLVEKKYETFKDIEDSGLKPLAEYRRTIERLEGVVETKLRWMKENLQKKDLSMCVRMAQRRRNVCCVTINIRHLWGRYHNADFEPLSSAKPVLWTEDMSFRLRQGLPGRENFNQAIDRFDEMGLLGKWYWTLKGSLGHDINADDNAQLKAKILHVSLLKQLVVVVVFGHSLATLVFIGELMIHRYGNPLKN